MKTKYKYIHFEKAPNPKKYNRDVWRVINTKHDLILGLIGWHPLWRCHIFTPEENTIFSQDCLADIIDFIKQLEKK